LIRITRQPVSRVSSPTAVKSVILKSSHAAERGGGFGTVAPGALNILSDHDLKYADTSSGERRLTAWPRRCAAEMPRS
jgi:hypothetical protein